MKIVPEIKYGGKIVVCQAGTAEVATSNENAIVNNNKIRKARNGIYGLVINSLPCRLCLTLWQMIAGITTNLR